MGEYARDVRMFREAVNYCNGLHVDFTVICGDLVQTPSEESFADFNTVKAGLTQPCYCAAGNHDIGNKPTAETLAQYRKLVGKDFFSFAHDGFAFVVANTQLWKAPVKNESERHDRWFKNTLRSFAAQGMPVFVVGHFPLYISQPNEKEQYFNLPLEKRTELLALFEECHVVAVLAGHTHRTQIRAYKGIQLVNGETTCKNFDGRPFGFRVWHVVDPRPYTHTFVPLQRLPVA